MQTKKEIVKKSIKKKGVKNLTNFKMYKTCVQINILFGIVGKLRHLLEVWMWPRPFSSKENILMFLSKLKNNLFYVYPIRRIYFIKRIFICLLRKSYIIWVWRWPKLSCAIFRKNKVLNNIPPPPLLPKMDQKSVYLGFTQIGITSNKGFLPKLNWSF